MGAVLNIERGGFLPLISRIKGYISSFIFNSRVLSIFLVNSSKDGKRHETDLLAPAPIINRFVIFVITAL
jgi:biotin transporter BioY